MKTSAPRWACSGAALLVLTSLCIGQAGRSPQPPVIREPALELAATKIKDTSWLSSKRPRLLAELISKAPPATKSRLALSLSSPHSQTRADRSFRIPSLSKLEGDKDFLGGAIRWSDMATGFFIPGVDISFGTHYQTDAPGAASKEIFDGVALASGVMTLDLNQMGPFTVVSAFTTTGDITSDGQPELFQKMIKVAGNKLRTQILEGQGYRIELSMPLDKAGDQLGSLIIEEQETVTLKLGGRVRSPNGVLSGSLETSKIILKSQAPIEVKANIQTNGPIEPGVQWKVTQNPGNLAISTPFATLPKKGSTSVSFTFGRTAATKSGTYPVAIEATAFNGTSKLTLSATVSVQVYWLTSNRGYFGSKWEICASSDGDYSFVFTPGPYFNSQAGSHFLLAMYGITSTGGYASSTYPTGAFGFRFPIQPAGQAQVKVGQDDGVAQKVKVIAVANYVASYGVQGGPNASVMNGGPGAGTNKSIMVYVPSS